MVSAQRPSVPEGVKVAVRRRCGFGCVMCGSPVYDYEHILGYGRTGHDPQHMTLLCPEHHREKTAGRLPLAQVIEADASPHNKRQIMGKPMPLYFSGDRFSIFLASNRIDHYLPEHARRGTSIMVDGIPVLGVARDHDRVLLTANLRDQDNQPVLIVRKGELRTATDAWDILFVGRTLTIRGGPGDIVLRLHLEPPDSVWVERGVFWTNGIRFEIDGFFLKCTNTGNAFGNLHCEHMETVLSVGQPARGYIDLREPTRLLGGVPPGFKPSETL